MIHRTIRDLSESEIKELTRLYRDTPLSSTEIAANFNLKVSSLRNYMSDAGVTKYKGEPLPFNPADKINQDTALEKANTKAKYFESLYKAQIKKKAIGEQMIDSLTESITSIEPLPTEPIPPKYSKTTHPQLAFALLSDLHIGEVVSLEETGGISQFNFELFNKRHALWTQKIIELVTLRRSIAPVPNLQIAALGDMITGEIHEELAKTNDLTLMQSVSLGGYIIAQSFAQLAPHFDNIHVDCVYGNHGRMTIKPEAKERSNSWDYLLYELVAMFCKDIKNIHFNIPKAFYTVVDCVGTRMLLMHGDGIKGGFAGFPFYGINKAVGNLRAVLQNGDDEFDGVAMGHFHSPMDIEGYGGPILVNGNYKGACEYSWGKLFLANRPSQTLCYFHPTRGRIATEYIYLDEADDMDIGYKYNLTDTWADSVDGMLED